MKSKAKMFLRLIAVVVSIVLCGCSQSPIEEAVKPSIQMDGKNLNSDQLNMTKLSVEFSSDEDKNLIEYLGYDTTIFSDFGDFYIVGENHFITKETLSMIRQDSLYQVLPSSTINDSYLVYEDRLQPICEKIHIQYGVAIDNSYIENAISAWNDIPNCNLDFSLGSNLDGRIEAIISGEYIGTGSIIREAITPLPKTPRNMIIDIANPIWNSLSVEQRRYLHMHTIGHIIRLGDLSDYQLWFNPNSIMKSHSGLSTTNNNLWSGLSESDKNSLAEIYPIPNEAELSYELNTIPVDVDQVMHIKAGETNTLGILYQNYYYPQNAGIRYEYAVLNGEEIYEQGNVSNNTVRLKIEDPNTYVFTLSVFADNTPLEKYETELLVHQIDKPVILNPRDSYTENNL